MGVPLLISVGVGHVRMLFIVTRMSGIELSFWAPKDDELGCLKSLQFLAWHLLEQHQLALALKDFS